MDGRNFLQCEYRNGTAWPDPAWVSDAYDFSRPELGVTQQEKYGQHHCFLHRIRPPIREWVLNVG